MQDTARPHPATQHPARQDTARRATTLLGLGATLALLAMLLLWQQVDAQACADGDLVAAGCTDAPDPEQA